MADMELERVQDIPGYKAILNAVIKSQIQQLVEQLAVHTDEESIVLTASVADGTLSHLGSKSGKGFLDNYEDIKSQFLGYCLKNKHRLVSLKNQETGCRQIHSTLAKHVTPSLRPVSTEKQSCSSNYYTRSSRIRQKPYAHGKTPEKKTLNAEQRNESLLSKPSVSSGDAESLSEVQVTMCDHNSEIKVECLDNFDDAFTFKETSKAKYDEMFAKEVSEVKSKDKDQESFQNEAQELTRNINQIPFCETSNCQQGTVSGSCLDNLAGDSNDESEIKVEEISESELQIEITDVKSLETEVAVSGPNDGITVLTPDDGTTPQSSNKHRLVSQNNQETGCRQIHPATAKHVTSSLKPMSAAKQSCCSNYYTRSSRIRQKPYAHGKTVDRKSLNTEQRNESMLSKPSVCSGDAESLSEVQVTVCDHNTEIKVERLDSFDDAFTFKETSKAKYDEMFAKEISELGSKDTKEVDSETGKISYINPQSFSEISSRCTNCPQGVVSSSCLANLDGHTNIESQKRLESDVEIIQEEDDTTVKVEEVSESELEIEITDVKSLETQAKQKSNQSMDMTFDPQVTVSGPRDGTTVLTPSYGITQQSHIGQILDINKNSQKALPEAHPVEPVKYTKTSRFVSHTSDCVNESNNQSGVGIRRTDDNVKKSTKRSIRHAADTFRQFLKEKGEDIYFEIMRKNKLAKLLSDFYMNVRTKDGQLYKLKSISQIRISLNLYLRYPPFSRKLDIIRDREFEDANKAYKSTVEKIKASGKGVTRHHPEITDKDLILLYRSHELNPNTPSGLQNRVQLTLRLSFSRESMNGMESMKKDTFKFAVDSDGTEYIYKSVTSSSVSSPESTDGCSVKLKEMKDSPGLCPVKAFKKYLSKLNPDCERLWQHPKDTDISSEAVWYQNKHLGKHPIERFMLELSQAVPLSTIYTNHSIRKTGKSIIFGDRRCLEEIMTLASLKKEI